MIWPNTKLAMAGVIVSIGSSFPFGYHSTVINPAEDVFKRFINESYVGEYGGEMSDSTFSLLWGFMIAILDVGAIVVLNEKIGRKGTLLANNIPNVVGTILLCVARRFNSIETFAVARFVIGINCGIASGAMEISLCLACTLAMVIGIPELLGTDERIYVLMALPIIPSLLQSAYLLGLPESPKHLLLTKLDEKGADGAFRYYHGPTVQLEQVKSVLRREKELQSGESMSLAECFAAPNIRRGFLVGMVASMSAVLTGISAVFFFSTDIFNKAGVPLDVAKYSTVIMTCLNSIATVLSSALLVERFGRRPLLLISLSGALLCHVSFVCFSLLYQYYRLQWASYIAVASLMVHVVMFSVGAGPLVWFFTTELVPQAARSKAQAFAGGFQWLGAIVDGLGFYPLFYAIGPYALLVTSIVPTSVFITILFIFMPETKDKDVNTLFAEYDANRAKKRGKKLESNRSSLAPLTPTLRSSTDLTRF